jgi:hypothetical protein
MRMKAGARFKQVFTVLPFNRKSCRSTGSGALCPAQPAPIGLVQQRSRMSRSRNVRSILALAGSMALLAANPAWSQPVQTVQQLLLQRLPVGTPLERYLESMRTDFFMVDADSDGEITQRDVDLNTVMEGVQARTHHPDGHAVRSRR